jgi:hypothetical protein
VYDAKTQSYKNANGETRQGEGAFRERLESAMTCAAKPAPEQRAVGNANQPFCVDTSRTDTSGDHYVTQRCLDGSVRESGTGTRNLAIWQWRTTTHADGSHSGGMGRNVFLANLERLKKCDVYPREGLK